MIGIMENTCDIRGLSLQLYGREVEITLKKNSQTSILLNGHSMKGSLSGRVWGNKLLPNGKYEETVVALTIRKGNKEIEIPCADIYLLSAVH